MPRSIPALVKPALLIWARERAGLPLAEAAAKADIELEQLRQWEQGEDRPSISQLRKLGEVYKRPLAVFFCSGPPEGFDPQSEFRRLPGVSRQTGSPGLRFALRMALFRREAARELYERLNEPIPECRAVAHPQRRRGSGWAACPRCTRDYVASSVELGRSAATLFCAECLAICR